MNRGGDGSGVRAGARAQGPMPVSSFRVADRRGYTLAVHSSSIQTQAREKKKNRYLL